MIDYFATISRGKIVLWCYLIWYIVIVYFYFDPSIRIWLNSVGISIVIGIALILSVSKPQGSKTDYWQIFRLFAMPFCVSSFSSLIKGRDFIFVVPPNPLEQSMAVGSCILFVSFVFLVKRTVKVNRLTPRSSGHG